MKVGKKKWLFCSAIFCAGIACACTLINDTSSSQWMKITMLMLGKLKFFAFFFLPFIFHLCRHRFVVVADAIKCKFILIPFLATGKFTISASNTIMPVYTAELYPTDIRNAGVGAGNFAGGLALIIVPYLSELVIITIVFSYPHSANIRVDNFLGSSFNPKLSKHLKLSIVMTTPASV